MNMSLLFYIVVKSFTITQKSVKEIQNPVMIYKSRPVKSNTGVYDD